MPTSSPTRSGASGKSSPGISAGNSSAIRRRWCSTCASRRNSPWRGFPGSINVPRGVLEQACEWDFDETVPELASRPERPIVVVCRSGNRSVLAADVMQEMGFADVVSLRTGVRGWNDFEQPLVDGRGLAVDADEADRRLGPNLRPGQQRPR